MFVLGTRPACKAAMNEDQKNLSRRRMKFSSFSCLELVGEVGYHSVK